MAGFERAILNKLDQVLAQDCPVCQTRTEHCHACGRPVGATSADAAHSRRQLDALLEGLNSRLIRSPALLPGLVADIDLTEEE